MENTQSSVPEVEIRDVEIPMRDGVHLHTRLYLPAGEPRPALLRRTPYPWEWMGADAFNTPNVQVAQGGFALAVQYVRGRFASEGDFVPFREGVDDAYDTIQWLTEQPWCTGEIGMYGQSYEGAVQLAAALAGHPALKCVVPQAFGSWDNGFPYARPGIFALGTAMGWAAQVAGEAEAATADSPADDSGTPSEGDEESGNEIYAIYEQAVREGWHEGLLAMTEGFRESLDAELAARPGADAKVMATHAPWWRDWVEADSSRQPYWEPMSFAGREDRILPALHISGWLDQFMWGTLDRFLHWRASAPTPELRDAQRLILGPWAHGLSSRQWDGHVKATPEADLFAHPDIARFHRSVLHGERNGILDEAPIKIFVMGDNEWRDEWEWPLARTIWTPLYLSSNGPANSLDGAGRLAAERPGIEPADSFVYDPSNPVPTVGGAVVPGLVLPGPGQYDQREVEQRADVLVYTAELQESALEVTGPVFLDLWITSSAVDTDFTAKLVDVFPDGKAVFVTQGIARPTIDHLYRRMDPEQTYRIRVELAPTSYVFKAGHAVRLEVSSSCFPLYDPNPNTGKHYRDDLTGETVTATQTVFHDESRPSHLTLPVIARS